MNREKDPGSSEGLRIWFRQAGGIAGAELKVSVDTAAVSPAEAQELEKLVDECGFFDLPGRRLGGLLDFIGPPRAFDTLRYEISITRGSSRHQVAFDDLSLPPALWPLVDHLAEMARARRRRASSEESQPR